MGIIKADTGTDLVSGLTNNVVVDYEGLARLAAVVFDGAGNVVSTNLNPDPSFNDFVEDTERLRYMKLGEPARPTHWAPFIKDNNKVKQYAKQVVNPIPLSVTTYDQIDELIFGSSPLEQDRTADIAPPAKPRARAISVGPIGFPEGYYTIAYAWIIGKDWQTTSYITSPGPRLPGPSDTPFYIPQGGGLLIVPPGEIITKATGIAIYLSEPRMNADAGIAHQQALLAPMYLVGRVRTKGIDQFVRLTGGFKWRKETGDNETFIGDNMPPLRVWKDNNPFTPHKGIRVQVRYAYITEQGGTKSEGNNQWHDVDNGHVALKFKPKVMHRHAIGWRPEIRFDLDTPGGEGSGPSKWYKIIKKGGKETYFDRNESAGVFAGYPKGWPDHANSTLDFVQENATDNTGIPAPTETLEMPTVLNLNNSGLTMGPHLVKLALYDKDENEGRISPDTRVNLPDSTDATKRAIRIHRPQFHNQMDNENLVDRDVENIDLPRGWIIPGRPFANPATLVVRPPREGVIRYLDKTNALTNFVAFRTPFATLAPDTDRFLVRFKQIVTGYGGGRIRVFLEEYPDGADENSNPSASTLIDSFGGDHDVKRLIRLSRQSSDPANPDVVRVATSTRAIRLRVEGQGNSARAGGRNFDVEFSLWGAWEGWGEPRKQTRLEQQRSLHTEPDEFSYPHGGYCVVRENPTDGPVKDDFTLIDRQGWETGLDAWTVFSTTGLSAARSQAAALQGQYGLRVQKNVVTATDNTDQTYSELTFANRSRAAVATDIYLKQFSNHAVDLMEVRSGADVLALLRLTGNGILQLVTFNAAGTPATTQLTDRLDDEEYLSVELELDGVGTTTGSVRAYVGRSRAARPNLPNATVTVDWTGRTANRVLLGHRRLNLSRDAIFTFYYDRTIVTVEGSTKVTPVGGNYIEYYGPHRTPKSEEYGPYGMRVPANPNTRYSVGVNVKWRNTPAGTDLFRIRAMDQNHNELRVYRPVVENIVDDSDGWVRKTLEGTNAISTPPETAYLEFFANNVGAGSIKIHGLQIEKGTVARQFSRTRARSGTMSVFFTTVPRGMFVNDRLIRLSEVKDIRRFTALATDDLETSFAVYYRSGMTLAECQSAVYTSDPTALPTSHKYFEVRIDLSTTVDTNTPEVRGIRMDVVRPDAILCNSDGTEYKGGVLVNGVSGVHAPPREDNVELASGGLANNPWGNRRVSRITFNVHAFRRSTMQKIVRDKKHVLELPDRKYTLYFEEPPVFTARPETRLYYPGEAEFFQMYSAEGVTGWIENEVLR